MKILSIDHGSSTGYAMFENDKYLDGGIIKLNSIEKLGEAYNMYEPLFSTFKPNVVVLEKVNVGGLKFGAINVIKLAQLQAIIRLLCYEYNCEVYEVNPTSMKKSITGNGRAEKIDVAKALSLALDVNLNDIYIPVPYKKKEGIKSYITDKSDAIALGYYYLKFIKN